MSRRCSEEPNDQKRSRANKALQTLDRAREIIANRSAEDDALDVIQWVENGHEIPPALSFDRLRTANVTRCEEVFHSVDGWTPAEWAVALAGECGEVCNAVKKLRRIADGTNTEKDPQTEAEAVNDIAEELADLIIYTDLLAARLGINLGGSVVVKFNSVSILRKSHVRL